MNSTPSGFISVRFEVSGRVQGVYFRKYTKAKADDLEMTGWCRNTPYGTVEGEYEYAVNCSLDQRGNGRYPPEVTEFRHWLCNVGSPRSDIDKCTFSEEVASTNRRFERFRVIR
mmetsp:Transcript_18183/g.37947  ORF Transcript_18183/g.37947 Transcript_18183/m.37947 type:complete len:114 (+) Transcript_18183:239-580(+)